MVYGKCSEGGSIKVAKILNLKIDDAAYQMKLADTIRHITFT